MSRKQDESATKEEEKEDIKRPQKAAASASASETASLPPPPAPAKAKTAVALSSTSAGGSSGRRKDSERSDDGEEGGGGGGGRTTRRLRGKKEGEGAAAAGDGDGLLENKRLSRYHVTRILVPKLAIIGLIRVMETHFVTSDYVMRRENADCALRRRLRKSNCSVEEAGSRKGLSPPFSPFALLCITEQVYPGEESVPFVPSLGHTPLVLLTSRGRRRRRR